MCRGSVGHRNGHEQAQCTHACVRKQAKEEERKKASAHFLLFHSERNINFMSAVILIVMRPVFTTHYLSQSPFVLFHTVASMEAAGTPAAAAELSTTTTEKSWRGAKINALDLVFHNSIVVRNRHNVNICRDGAGNLRKGNTSWWGRGWGLWLFSCSIRQSQAKMNE